MGLPTFIEKGFRYNNYSLFFKDFFGARIQKVSIDAGFTCPNRDGTISLGGCTYCNNNAFNPSYCNPEKNILQQIDEGILFHKTRYKKADKYLAYFQAYSNTFASLKILKETFETALSHNEIIGIVIGTRIDCINDEKLKYLSELSKNHYVIIEYGIETTNNATLNYINRGHTFEKAEEIIYKTARYNINVGVHFIFGLPFETKIEMLNRANIVSNLPIKTIKFHQLQIIKNTKMALQYAENPDVFSLFEREEYIQFICDFLEMLNPNIVVERLSAEAPPRYIIAPIWNGFRSFEIANQINNELIKRNTYQGCKNNIT